MARSMQQDHIGNAGHLGDFQFCTRIGNVTDDAGHPGMAEADGGFNSGIPARGNPAFKQQGRFAGREDGKIAHAYQLSAPALLNP